MKECQILKLKLDNYECASIRKRRKIFDSMVHNIDSDCALCA